MGLYRQRQLVLRAPERIDIIAAFLHVFRVGAHAMRHPGPFAVQVNSTAPSQVLFLFPKS